MTHAEQRLAERMTPAEATVLGAAIAKLAATLDPKLDFAIHIGRLPETRGSWTFEDGGRGDSNGSNIWAIIRKGNVVTVMYRRDAQPSTPEALRVDRVGKVRVK